MVRVISGQTLRSELLDQDAPPLVRAWAAQPPGWLDVRTVSSAVDDPAWRALDAGEREALALARMLGVELVLMDDHAGVAVARQQGLAATGTLGVLDRSARRGLVDLRPPEGCSSLPTNRCAATRQADAVVEAILLRTPARFLFNARILVIDHLRPAR
jgi:hypothetical protein